MDVSTHRKFFYALLLLLAFLFRLWYGLNSEFWFEDEFQTYLIGLKFYTTHEWPYFGPDVTSVIQIPGALQGLIVGLPFFVYPAPEAPYVLLNLLSLASLCLLAWYTTKRLPEIPRWIVWAWLLTAPWAMNLSTHIINPSYVLTGGVLFFIGFLETFPRTTCNLLSPRTANFMLGFALFWVMQFHMSWVALVPFVSVSLYFQTRSCGRAMWKPLAWFACGACITGAFVLPTYLKFGLRAGSGDTSAVVIFNAENLKQHLNLVEGILGRFLSFASFELPRFIGGNTHARLQFLREHLWLTPFVAFLTIIGILQPIALLLLWFRRRHAHSDWPAIKYLTLATLLLLYASFIFSFRDPHSHTFYVTLPLAMIYSFYCWSPYLIHRRWQIFAAIVIISGIIFHTGLALHNRAHHSLYLNRSIPQTAIETKDYHLMGERRTGARY